MADMLRLHPQDNVVVAAADLRPGTDLPAAGLRVLADVPRGHKLASTPIPAGAAVRKYGQIIGFATRDIAPGEPVHSHNLAFGEFAREYAFGQDATPTVCLPEPERATFEGFPRADGRVGTRNYIGVLASVNCSNSVAQRIADAFPAESLADYPRVDGVVALPHQTGCCIPLDGDTHANLERTLAGYASHPNFAGVLLVGLGCEVAQIDTLLARHGLTPGERLRRLIIQDTGGTAATVAAGIAAVRELVSAANQAQRRTCPASALTLALECGGSDAYSGITANPALGLAVDTLVRHGGTAILGETPEIYGAEHLLTRRAVSRAVGEKLLARIDWWQHHTAANGALLDNNPTPGNKQGGLTTILEKSLGAAAKSGTTPLMEVYRYAEPVTARGFVFMDTPGYDPASITGMVAGGANLTCFTTGRGSVYGGKPVPSIKLATNTPMYQRLADDMDLNCGVIADGTASLEAVGQEIFRTLLAVASGHRPRSEVHGIGGLEFCPWQVGVVL
jgi:altronate hydrolase